MASPLKLRHLPRYGELGRLLVAHRRALQGGSQGAEADATELVETLEDMGPTYVKLGQLLSSRVDLLPHEYTEALGRLQDRVEPFAYSEVRAIVEQELGLRLSSAFSRFEERPFAAASLGQVHDASLRDGRRVAVKVQRPAIRQQILEDMDVISELAEALDEHLEVAERLGFSQVVAEFRRSLLAELDYKEEARNLRMLRGFLEPYPRLVTSEPVEDLTAARVLTMSFVEGRNLRDVGRLARSEADGRELTDELFKAYLDQVLVHGVFHADPHPGNVLLMADGRLALIDLGMIARVAPDLQESMLRLLVALSEGRGTEVAEALERTGERLPGFDADGYARQVSAFVVRVGGATLAELQVGRQLAELSRIGVTHGLRPAPELTMLARALLSLDAVARRLDADYAPTVAIREHAMSLMRHRMLQAVSPASLVASALDAKEFTERLPSRMNKVLDALSEGQFTVKVDGVDESELMRGVQKLANRGAAGVLAAALVLSAAVFSVNSGGPRWFGESAYTIVCLGLAFAIGATIALTTLRHDLPQHRRPSGKSP